MTRQQQITALVGDDPARSELAMLMVTDLHEAVYGRTWTWARPESPAQVWQRLLEVVRVAFCPSSNEERFAYWRSHYAGDTVWDALRYAREHPVEVAAWNSVRLEHEAAGRIPPQS